MHRNYRYWRDDNPAACADAADAHEALRDGSENCWENAWLTEEINELRVTE